MLAGIAPGAASGEELVQLNLVDALERVEAGNLDLKAAHELVVQSSQMARRDKSAILPGLAVAASQGRAKSSFGFLDDTGEEFIEPIHINSFDAKVVGQYNFFDPVSIATYFAAKRGVDVAKFEFEAALQETLFSTAQLFFMHRKNRQELESIAKNIELAAVSLERAEAFLDAGSGPIIDVTRARARLAIERQTELQQQTELAESGFALVRLLNMPLDQGLEAIPFPINLDTLVDVDSMISAALLGRPDYQQARNELERTVLETKAARYQRVPSLSMRGEWGHFGEEAFDGEEQETWQVGLAVDVPIFESGKIDAAKKLALSRFHAQEYRIESLKRTIESEIRLAASSLGLQRAQLEVAELNLQLAKDELELARIRYEEGLGDNRELIDAQTRLAESDFNAVEAEFNYQVARLEVFRALGDVREFLK